MESRRYPLIPFSFIYLVLSSLRNLFYGLGVLRQHALGARVISVGNITWGGTGKTPAVLFILEALLKKGLKPAVLIRGYGKDEQVLFSRQVPAVPVKVGKDRVKNGMAAIIEDSADTLILDDGFQYRRLKRDADIVCIDATDPFGNGWLIPAGSMRESLRGLKRADIFLITRVDLIKDRAAFRELEIKLKRVNPKALIVKSVHMPQDFYRLSDNEKTEITRLRDRDIVLISAVGNPASFEKTVSGLGLKVKRHFIFRDHFWYKKGDLENINSYCKDNGIGAAITTEKDAVRLRDAACAARDVDIFVLSVRLNIIENEQGFHSRLFRIYNS